jgi:sulfatase maturation enzyme AslB (radical SAM superfamily)
MWKYEDIDQINIEISSLCNSICAWCPRYENMSTVVNKQLTPQYISIDKFKEWFPPELIRRVKHWTYSGDYGDAGTNPDLPKIFEYTFHHNPEASLQMNTNGGMKTLKFWAELGRIFSQRKQRNMVFSIDGLEDTNHIYRRNVKWQKVMENVSAYIKAGGRADWDYLVFKHNHHQVEEARSLSQDMGFNNFYVKNPSGFEKGNMVVRDKDYNILYEIEPVDDKQILQGYPDLNGVKAEDIPYDVFKDRIESHFKDVDGEIKCFSMRNGLELRVAADGNVYPCCHMGNLSKHPREVSQISKAQLSNYFKDIEHNLHNKSLKDILDTDPFKPIYNSWEKKSCLACWQACGVNADKQTAMSRVYGEKEKLYGTT